MLALDYLLAVVLLTAPPGAAQPAGMEKCFPALRLPLQGIAVGWELLDAREIRFLHILERPEEFSADLNLLRRRYHDLLNAPPLSDSFRFPDRATANELLAFNRAYRQHLDVRQPVETAHGGELRLVVQETDHLYDVWDAVRDARCDYYYVPARRQALKRLRELVGVDLYESGQLPPCVPLWRFSGP